MTRTDNIEQLWYNSHIIIEELKPNKVKELHVSSVAAGISLDVDCENDYRIC